MRHVRRDERKYYEDLLQYSKQHLMVRLMEYLMAENLHKYVIRNDMTNVDQKYELSVQKVNFQNQTTMGQYFE